MGKRSIVKSIRQALIGVTGAMLVAPAAAAPTPSLVDPVTAKADFEELYLRLQRAHFNLYARTSKAAYDRLYQRMSADFDAPLTPLETAKRFQRFVAFGKVAHARIDSAYSAFSEHLAGGGKAFPLTLRLMRGRAFVAENKSGLTQLRSGDELIRLQGKPIRFWLTRCARNLSADTAYMADALMEFDFPMLLWLEAGAAEAFDVTFKQPDGRRYRLSLPARTRAEMQRAMQSQPARLDLSKTDRTWKMLDAGVGYLRPGPFYNSDPTATDMYDTSGFRRFIDGAFEGLIAAGAKSLIIDLRDNPGGDSSFSDLMVSWFADKPYRFNSAFLIKVSPETVASNAQRLPTSPPGSISHRFAALYAGAKPGQIVRFETPYAQPRVGTRFQAPLYLLINRNSYSNAVAVAATVQDYGFGKILGEETSDLATTYGAMESFTLPRTGLKVGFPKAHIIRPNGDTAARGVRPDLRIETPIVEPVWDPVLQKAISIARDGTKNRAAIMPSHRALTGVGVGVGA